MCFGMNANKWAPKLVIVLQLATWTIVGLVLLQKGVSSLRTPLPRTSRAVRTQVTLSETSKLTPEFENGIRKNGREEQDIRDNSDSEKWSHLPIPAGNSKKGFRATRDKDRVLSNRSANVVDVSDEPVKLDEKLKGNENNRTESVPREDSAGNENGTQIAGEATGWTGPMAGGPGIRKQNRNRELGSAGRNGAASGAAAAAAVAMLVIGVVMLVLGPAIVILRALEGRRRARRLTKSRARKDLPPSYEQATLMDEAPRYSTLHLNATSDSLLLPCSSTPSTSDSNSQTRNPSSDN